MSDSGMSSSSEIESVLEALEDLKERYMDPMFSRPEGPEKKEFTGDELDQKNRLFDQVQSTLVPLIQEQVDSSGVGVADEEAYTYICSWM
ncbi:hypothetical protein MJO29_016170 [Puccinia striiformis f. sp. tritici]|nr:hypothetical protein MJO29_016170 [Puccinia striiformis f. sp. tritici]